MTHGDDSGLIVPPRIAPTQVVIIPIAAHKGGVNEKAAELAEILKAAGIRVSVDMTDNSPGWKFAEHEMKGVPMRIEIGPRDIQNGSFVAVARDNREKTVVPFEGCAEKVKELLDGVHDRLYEKALANRERRTYTAHTFDEIKEFAKENCFIKTMWCGDEACELKLKDEVGVTSRCMPFGAEPFDDVCPICGKKATKVIYWGKAY